MRRSLALAAALGVGAALTLAPTPAAAGVLVVTRTDDPVPDGCALGDCSLREAVLDANMAGDPDTIVLPAGTYALSIPPDGTPDDGEDGDLDLFGELTITGAGAASSALDAGGIDRVLTVEFGATVTIEDLTIRGGSTADLNGGGGLQNIGDLTLRQVAVADNVATAGAGGGILNGNMSSELTVLDSAISGNRTTLSSGDGGAIENRNMATATLTNVTISGNEANQAAGGIHADTGTVTLTNATITGNRADADAGGTSGQGGGIRVGGATMTMSNTILAGNVDTPSFGDDADCAGTITSAGNNLVGNATSPNCVFAPIGGDLTGVNPQLGPLADNGGPTMTHALLPSSPAVDTGGVGCPPADQRGAPRSGACDIGAYELVRCAGVIVDRVGTAGDDDLTGTGSANGVLALGGNDAVAAGGGNDAVCGGDGNDRLAGEGGKDRLSGEAGNDRLSGGSKPDRLKGGPGRDRLSGGKGKDRCQGGPGRDRNRTCERGKP